jgi:hypothetical protein
MSTPATIQVDDLIFFQSHDGYPYDVTTELEKIVKEAKIRASRNPDYLFFANLKYLMMEADYECSSLNGYPSNYSYEIDEDGNIFVHNPKGFSVSCKWLKEESEMSHSFKVIITSSEGMEREFDSWDEYEEMFFCHCSSPSTDMVYRMVDIDGTNWEEHLVCPKCGNDVGVI